MLEHSPSLLAPSCAPCVVLLYNLFPTSSSSSSFFFLPRLPPPLLLLLTPSPSPLRRLPSPVPPLALFPPMVCVRPSSPTIALRHFWERFAVSLPLNVRRRSRRQEKCSRWWPAIVRSRCYALIECHLMS